MGIIGFLAGVLFKKGWLRRTRASLAVFGAFTAAVIIYGGIMNPAAAIKYRKLNMKQLDHRRRLIDSFVNAIHLFDDYLVITFNYKEGTKRVTFAEIEEAFGSDLSSLTAPPKALRTLRFRGFSLFLFFSTAYGIVFGR